MCRRAERISVTAASDCNGHDLFKVDHRPELLRGVESEGGELGASLYTFKNFNTPIFRFSWKKYRVTERHAVVCCLAVRPACYRCCWQEPQGVTDTFERLKAALADGYAIERELGSGEMVLLRRLVEG